LGLTAAICFADFSYFGARKGSMRTIVGRLWLLIAISLGTPLVGDHATSAPATPPQAAPGDSAPQAYLPLIVRRCDAYTAALHLSTPATTVQVGKTITVTATLLNHGCVALGLPSYRLTLSPQPPLTPLNPMPQTHFFAVAPQTSDEATFAFTTSTTGQAVLTGTVDFELHFESGPPFWRRSTSTPLTISVTQ
jgi:hypothetical protein